MRKRSLVVLWTIPLALGLAACGGGDDGATGTSNGTGGTLTLAPIVVAQPWDIKDAGLGNNTVYYQPVYDQLFRLNPEAEVGPNLATEWSYDDTLTHLTVKLRDDVTFTDGTKFDATAVQANLMNTKGGTSEAANQLKSVDSVDVVDATTATINLSAPDPSLVPNLGSTAGMMASPKAIGTPGLQTEPVGSGPYTLDMANTTADAKYTFVRNPDYWNPDAFPFDKIVLTPLTDATAVMNALQSGQIDGALVSDPKNVATLQGAGLNILQYPSGDVGGLYIWDRGGTQVPELGDVRVRQALNYAFDKDAIITTAFNGLGTATTQVFNPDTTAYDESLNDTYPYDPEKAKELLAAAGAEDLVLPMPDLSAFFPSAQAAIVEQLAAVGVTAQLDTAPADQVINDLLAGKWPVSLFTLASFRPWDTIQIQLTPDALWNPLKYEDPTVTDLIAQAQVATGDAQDELFRQINAYTVEQAWNAPWLAVENSFAYSDDVTVTAQKFAIVPGIYNFAPAS
jgi:peptide/nickel transport system substrate-binding protein